MNGIERQLRAVGLRAFGRMVERAPALRVASQGLERVPCPHRSGAIAMRRPKCWGDTSRAW